MLLVLPVMALVTLGVRGGQAAGTSSAQFLKLGAGARAAAMGNAFSSISDDVTATYWNPAGISQIATPELSMMQNNWMMGSSYQYLGAALPREHYVMGLSLYRMNYGSIDRYNNSNVKDGSFDAGSLAGSFTAATKLNSNLHIGATLKYISESIESEKASSFAGDFGVLLSREKYKLGLVLQNFGPGLKFVKEKENLPQTIRVGVSTQLLQEKLLVALDLSKSNDNNTTLHGGVEYKLNSRLFLRGGYQMTPGHQIDVSGITNITGGLGVNLGLFNLDYALTPFGDLGISHKISVLVRFK